MRLHLFALGWLIGLSFFTPRAHAQKLSPQAEISILTIAPGSELFNAFGHSAIRVYDPAQRLDIAYNYGTFDFSDPNFYFKFCQGQLDYYLSTSRTQPWINYYESRQRAVYELVLRLDSTEKERVYNYLLNNALPGNKYYRYQFFVDNCATRIRDVFEVCLGNKMTYHFDYIDSSLSYRDYVDEYIEGSRFWGDFGIDIGLGSPTDRIAGPRGAMFIPDYLEKGFAMASIRTDSGEVGLVKRSGYLKDTPTPDYTESRNTSPFTLFSVLLVLVILLTIAELYFKRDFWGIDMLFFILYGIAGIVLTYLWFFTLHGDTQDNYNVAFLFPLHFIAGLFLWSARWRNNVLVRYYFAFHFALLLLFAAALLIGMGIIPQDIHIASLPLILLLALRCYRRAFKA